MSRETPIIVAQKPLTKPVLWNRLGSLIAIARVKYLSNTRNCCEGRYLASS